MTNWACDNWRRTDEGIWEVREGHRHFMYAQLMCWVALDRALRLADRRSFPADREGWYWTRDATYYEEIMSRGWNSHRKAFTHLALN
jgi:GH15 family glucan-1,4-alpha-glucosidase